MWFCDVEAMWITVCTVRLYAVETMCGSIVCTVWIYCIGLLCRPAVGSVLCGATVWTYYVDLMCDATM